MTSGSPFQHRTVSGQAPTCDDDRNRLRLKPDWRPSMKVAAVDLLSLQVDPFAEVWL
jgi:hypothetical protein